MTGERATAVWLEEQLERALERIESLTRDVVRAHASHAAREQELDDLRTTLATIEGRTRRSELAQDALPEIRRALASVEERLTAESSLRRDQLSAADRGRERDDSADAGLARVMLELAERVVAIERTQAASVDRDAQRAAAAAEVAQEQQQLITRAETITAQVESLMRGVRQESSDLDAFREAIEASRIHTAAVEARTETMQRDLQQFGDQLAQVSQHLDRETAFADLIEQHRVLRQRVEDGLASLERDAESKTHTTRAEVEERALLRAHVASMDRALLQLAERVEAQRLVLLDHFQRVTDSAEAAGRRQSDEIDRQVRAARELLVRLSESADAATREQPL
ncbi:MAG: hypothetical protein DWI48_03845 [Chloroflexi bacterium]|nr:MAG: hypothetical protein DWI48_03845 [Chloroflexota bacterium]